MRLTTWNNTFSCIFDRLVLFVAVIELNLLAVSFLLQRTALKSPGSPHNSTGERKAQNLFYFTYTP